MAHGFYAAETCASQHDGVKCFAGAFSDFNSDYCNDHLDAIDGI